ncbi:MAG TPA: hypothetical protein GX000_00345 [Actinomyces sp.]|nr:hypothetical protein [Acidobacteriota bacterium]HHT40085.1 hypothetical protein [Actinomyces sp.]
MGTNPQDALNRLIAAFEAHAQAARAADLADASIVEAAEARLRDAFFTYDDVLFNNYGVDLPFDVLEDDDLDDDDYDEDDYDENGDDDEEDDWDDYDDDYDEDDLDED